MGRVYTSGDQFSTDMIKDLFLKMYPVGSIYLSVNSTNPSSLFGGTWERIKDRFLLAAGDTYAAGGTGGASTVLLTAAQSGIPAHNHSQNAHVHGHLQYDSSGVGGILGHSHGASVGRSKANMSSGTKYVFASETNTELVYVNPTSTATTATNNNNAAANASEAHENMPPYLAVYVWKRTA